VKVVTSSFTATFGTDYDEVMEAAIGVKSDAAVAKKGFPTKKDFTAALPLLKQTIDVGKND
jgi:hypothetical protein